MFRFALSSNAICFIPIFAVIILQVTGQTYHVVTLSGVGTGGATDGAATVALFAAPEGICLGPGGSFIYVTESSGQRIRKVTPTGSTSLLAGISIAGLVNGPATNAYFSYPSGCVFDSSGSMIIADHNNHAFRKLNMVTGIVSTVAGTGAPGYINAVGTYATFSGHYGLCIDNTDNVFVPDTLNHRIRKITPANVVTLFAGTGGQATTDGAATSASFNSPCGCVFDATNNRLIIADTYNFNIRSITTMGTAVVSTISGRSAAGFADGPVSSAYFYYPISVALDSKLSIIVSDGYNYRIRRIANSVVSTVAGTGAPSSIDGYSTAATFANPRQIVVDSSDNIFLADYAGNRIRKVVTCNWGAFFDYNAKACKCSGGYEILANNTCVACANGFYQPSATNTPCLQCPVGYESSADKMSCVQCSVGKYRDLTMPTCQYCPLGSSIKCDQSGCDACPTGKSRSLLTATNCSDCLVGYESAPDKASCVQCGGGKYRPSSEYLVCIPCPYGATCNSTSMISCQAGFKISSVGNGCDQCAVGYQMSSDGLSCVACVSGSSYRASLSQTTCQNCPSNSLCTTTGFTCNAGYEISADSLSCTQCALGYAKASGGNTACTQCTIGQESNAGRTACVNCVSGSTYRSSLTQTTCQSCPSYSACITTGFSCNAGYEPTGDGIGCQLCGEGYTKSASGNTACSQCAVGTESVANRQSCVACSSGKYRPNTIFNKCVPCPSNGVCTASALTKCSNGFKVNVAGDGCDQCPIGQDSSNGLNCVGCQAGFFKPDQSFSMCIQCPVGSSCGGSSISCQSGFYFDTNAQCKRNDTFFALQQTGTQTASTVTAYVTLTQTQTSTTTSTSTTSIYATATVQLTNTLAASWVTATLERTNILTASAVSVSVPAVVTQYVTVSVSVEVTSTLITSQTAQTVTVSISDTSLPSPQAQTANSVTIESIGTLPISPLIFGIIAFLSGLFVMFIMSLVCCRKQSQRRKDEDFEGMTTSAMNTTSQRTFTTNSMR